MKKVEYTPLNLPKDLVQELKEMRQQYSERAGKNITFEKMIRNMIECRKKYGGLKLGSDTIRELKIWKVAYDNVRYDKVSYDEMVQDMMHCNRKYKWWRKNEREIVTYYKAIKLSKAKGISLDEAKEQVVNYDTDPSTSSRGKNSPFSQAHTMYSNYVWDKNQEDLL